MSNIIDMEEWRKKKTEDNRWVPATSLADLFDQEERRIWEEFKKMACQNHTEKPEENQ